MGPLLEQTRIGGLRETRVETDAVTLGRDRRGHSTDMRGLEDLELKSRVEADVATPRTGAVP